MSLKYIMEDEPYEMATYGESEMSTPNTSHLKEEIDVSYYNRDSKEITVKLEVSFKYVYNSRGEEVKQYDILQMEEGWKQITGESECFYSWNVPNN
jgi:hypothetical protein